MTVMSARFYTVTIYSLIEITNCGRSPITLAVQTGRRNCRTDIWKSGVAGATKTGVIPPSAILNIADVHLVTVRQPKTWKPY